MPAGSKVHKMYTALKRQGHSKSSAARIAQSKTGQALSTGRAAKRTKATHKRKKTR